MSRSDALRDEIALGTEVWPRVLDVADRVITAVRLVHRGSTLLGLGIGAVLSFMTLKRSTAGLFQGAGTVLRWMRVLRG